MDHDPRDDTLRLILRESRGNLDHAAQIFERGRLATGDHSTLKIVGPWYVTVLWTTTRLSLTWFVRRKDAPEPCPTLSLPGKAVYIGLAGKIQVAIGNRYTTLSGGGITSLHRDTQHTLEATGDHAELVQVLVGSK